MSTTSERFQKFISDLQLSDAQLQDAITKHTGVRKTLHDAYYDAGFVKSQSSPWDSTAIDDPDYRLQELRAYTSFDILLDETTRYRTSLLIGSYGKNTAIAPPSDIDILFEMPSTVFERYDSSPWNGQSQLLQDVKAVLKARYPSTDIRADGQVVVVPFASYKIEVLPAFLLSTGGYCYPHTHSGGSWKKTNPRAEREDLRASNKRTQGNTVKLIKILKAWKQYCTVPIKSLVLELRAVRFLGSWQYANRGASFYDWMVRDFLRDLLLNVNGSAPIPGISELLQYGDSWQSKAQTALERSIKACDFETNKQSDAATGEWRKIFGERYPY